jgi:hypothetical protein
LIVIDIEAGGSSLADHSFRSEADVWLARELKDCCGGDADGKSRGAISECDICGKHDDA